MSEVTETLNTNNQLNTNYDFSKTFIGDNDFKDIVLLNPEGTEQVLPVGTLLGRISANSKVQVLKSAAVDGSQYPVGVLAQEFTLAAAAEVDTRMCIGGDVVKGKVIFNGADTLATVIDARQLGDRIESDTLGIYLVDSVELTDFDNQ